MSDYDIFGNIAIMKGEGKTKKEKLVEASELIKIPGVTTVLEKATNVRGRLRTIKTKHLLGKRTRVAILKENGCIFKLDVESCYFSPRLANERQLISQKIKNTDRVLVMFAGVGVYPIVIYKYSKPEKIIGVELGRECSRYFKENLKLNKIPEGRIEVIQGDVKGVIPKLIEGKYKLGNPQNLLDKNFGTSKTKRRIKKGFEGFDVVIMARPNLNETFLKWGLSVCKKNTRLFYYGFCKDSDADKLLEDIATEAKKYKKKIKIMDICAAGEIAPYKHRFRVEIKIL